MRAQCHRPLSVRQFTSAMLGMFLATCAAAAENGMDEYQVKASYLYNFASFTEWPVVTGPELMLCIYGPDPFGADIDALQGRNVGGRSLAVTRVATVERLDTCQIVFLSREVISNLPRILDEVRGRNILTIADSPGALQEGVGINMRNEAGRISFEVNLDAVHEHGLNLSFRLLRLAAEVRN